jgi:aspartate racemase
MKTAGIVGGIGPESTLEYYRLIVALYRERNPDGSYPQLIINSIDMRRMRSLIEANNLPDLTGSFWERYSN